MIEENISPEQNQSSHEEIFESFFGPGSEEEQLRIRELAGRLGVRDNDAIWIIIYVFNYFGRFYRDLPQRIRESSEGCLKDLQESCSAISETEMKKAQILFAETLANSTKKILESQEKKLWLYDLFMPLAWSCLGVFLLCLLAFIGGAAIAGKGWGHSPIEAIFNAPAGWIIPLALVPLCGFLFFKGFLEEGKRKALHFIMAGSLIVAVLLSLHFIFL